MLVNPKQLFNQTSVTASPIQNMASATTTEPAYFTPDQSILNIKIGQVSQLLGKPTLPSSGLSNPQQLFQNSLKPQPTLPTGIQAESIPAKTHPSLNAKEIINTGIKDIQSRSIHLSREAAAGLNKMIQIAKSKNLEVRVSSSYRSIEHQHDLWEDAVEKYGSASKARKWVAPPGHSRHNFGNAIDLRIHRAGKRIPQAEFDQIIAQAGMYRPMSWEGWHVEPLSTKVERNLA